MAYAPLLPLLYPPIPGDALPVPYRLVIRTPDGVKQGELEGTANRGFTSLAAAIQINSPGTLQFTTLATNTLISELLPDSQIELWRGALLLFSTLFQDATYTLDADSRELFTATCYGTRDLLARPIVAWQPDTINRTQFDEFPAETIMVTLVKYNATSFATVANGRLLDFPLPRVSVENDQGRGVPVARADISGKVLLDELRELATLGHVDFDVVQTAPRAWVFRVYNGYSGTDKRPTIVFSPTRHNMSAANYVKSFNTPRTVVVAGGTGEGKARETAVRYGPDYATTYHREYFHADTSAAGALLTSAADRILQERRVKPTLSFTPAQVAGVRFGVDYNVGDLVRGVYRDVTADYKVAGVNISLPSEGQEQISVVLEEYQDVML